MGKSAKFTRVGSKEYKQQQQILKNSRQLPEAPAKTVNKKTAAPKPALTKKTTESGKAVDYLKLLSSKKRLNRNN